MTYIAGESLELTKLHLNAQVQGKPSRTGTARKNEQAELLDL